MSEYRVTVPPEIEDRFTWATEESERVKMSDRQIERHLMLTYQEVWKCECGGDMFPTGVMLTSMPPIYPHRCNRCGLEYSTSTVQYPRIVHSMTPAAPAATAPSVASDAELGALVRQMPEKLPNGATLSYHGGCELMPWRVGSGLTVFFQPTPQQALLCAFERFSPTEIKESEKAGHD